MKNIINKIALRNIFVIMHKNGKRQAFDIGRILYIQHFDLQNYFVKYQAKSLINDFFFNVAIRVPKKCIKLAFKRNLLKRRFLHALYLYVKDNILFNFDNNYSHLNKNSHYYIFNIERYASFSEMQNNIANYFTNNKITYKFS